MLITTKIYCVLWLVVWTYCTQLKLLRKKKKQNKKVIYEQRMCTSEIKKHEVGVVAQWIKLYPIWEYHFRLEALLPVQLPVNLPGNTAEDGQNT